MLYIPLVRQTPLIVEPFTLYPYNVLLSAAICAGCTCALRRGLRFGIPWTVNVCGLCCMFLASLVFSHLAWLVL
jgi:hypothetical protein